MGLYTSFKLIVPYFCKARVSPARVRNSYSLMAHRDLLIHHLAVRSQPVILRVAFKGAISRQSMVTTSFVFAI